MTAKAIDRSTTGALKGIALILMFVHHLFAFPEFLIDSIHYSGIQTFADLFCMPTEICVCIFAFLTGYFYCFSKDRTIRYSIRKITDLYISYWVVYLVLLALAVALGCYDFSLYVFAFELTAARTDIMVFCWYVVFYALTMLLLPLLTGKGKRSPWTDVLLVLLVPIIAGSILTKRELGGIWYDLSTYLVEWFPCVATGYLFAKYNLFDPFFDRPASTVSRKPVQILLWVAAIVAACTGRYWCNYLYAGELLIRGGGYRLVFKTDILYTPMFIWGAVNLLQYVKKVRPCFRILETIGKYSLLMWFLHCAFYNVCRDILQPILYAPKIPVLVVIWGLFLNLIPALLLDPVIRKLQGWKNKIL